MNTSPEEGAEDGNDNSEILATSFDPRMAESYSFEEKLDVLEDIYGEDFDDIVLKTIQNLYNLGLPLACLYTMGFATLTDEGRHSIENTFAGIFVTVFRLGRGHLFNEAFSNVREVLNLPDEREDNWDHDDFVDSDEEDEEGQASRG